MKLAVTAFAVLCSGAAAQTSSTCCPVVELRRYVLHPGMRDTLITLFDREFVETQEAAGMTLIAQFRDIDHPDVFTWLRGFPDMPSRATSLGAFYGGPVWARHREAANRTMVSSDDVRLLRPVHPGSGFAPAGLRASPGATKIPAGLVAVTIYTLASPPSEEFHELFDRSVVPHLAASGARPFAVLETEPARNTFPRLPIREGGHAFVWLARFANLKAYERHVAALAADQRWTTEIQPALQRYLAVPAEVWRLTATARSHTLR